MLRRGREMVSSLWQAVTNTFIGEPERDTHPNQKVAVLTLIGHSIGFGNIWRFPVLCHQYGPATFMVAYITALLVIGIPVFFLEICLGQYVSQGPTYVFANIAPIFTGLGWGMLWMSFLTCIYYMIILTWILYYLYQLLLSAITMIPPPWSTCDNEYNTQACFCSKEQLSCKMFSNSTRCESSPTSFQEFFHYGLLGKPKNYTICGHGTGVPISESFGTIQGHLLMCLAVCWVLVAVIVASGTKYRGRVLSFTVVFPYVILGFMLLIVVTAMSEGAGLEHLWQTLDMEHLRNGKLWVDAGVQIIFSTGVGFGGIITIASYNTLKQNTLRDGFIVPVVNSATSVMAGIIIFCVLGDMAKISDVPIEDVLEANNAMPFIAMHKALSLMPCGWNLVWTMLFFIMLFLMGLSTQLTWINTITTTIFDNFQETRAHKLQAVGILCIIMCVLGIPMCMQNGITVFDFMKNYTCTPASQIFVLLEVIIVCYVFGFKNFLWIVQNLMCVSIPTSVKYYLKATLCLATPALLLFVLVSEVRNGFGFNTRCLTISWISLSNFSCFGWLLVPSYLIILCGFMVYVIYKHKNYTDYKREWSVLFHHTKDFIPEVKRRESMAVSESANDQHGFAEYVLRF